MSKVTNSLTRNIKFDPTQFVTFCVIKLKIAQKPKMKKLLPLLSLLIWSLSATATHNRAGEITYRWINGLTYEVTITTYTRACDLCADRCELEIRWGDSATSILPRSNGSSLRCANARDGEIIDAVNRIRKNVYVGTHTYDAPGIYTLVMEDRNRNAGISNIINSDQVPFYIETELFISPSLGANNSPVLTNPPVERGCINKRFEHNPGAFDPDGDSLAYRLVLSRAENGAPITTIYNPTYVQDSVKIDRQTGLLYWDLPRNVGQYNFALEVIEYRKNQQGRYVRIGYVTRDLQVDIEDCGNNPPVVAPVGPFCVEAGTSLNFSVSASDPDGDDVTLTAFGGPFVTSPRASFPSVTGPEPVTGFFNWNTSCDLVRKQPYQVSFKAEDLPPDPFDVPLSDIYTTEITIIAPAPKNPRADAEGLSIRLDWDPSICSQAAGYLVYRRAGLYGFVPGNCETGVPAYTGYAFLDSLDGGLNDNSYLDTNNIEIGKEYCYMVVAYFNDEALSYASVEFCAALPLSLPLLTQVDVSSTDLQNGTMEIAWIAPPEFDSTLFPPPYRMDLMRRERDGGNFGFLSSFNGLVDGSFSDGNLNTQELSYEYRIDLYSGPNADLVGESADASSIFTESKGVDRAVELDFNFDTPWSNERFVIYRENPTGSGNFDSIGESFSQEYVDTGLVNGETYCYYAEGYGRYTASDSLPKPLINRSQIKCAAARDTIAPCVPMFSARNVCPDTIYFSWVLDKSPGCSDDVKMINIYFRTGENSFGNQPFLSIPTRGDSTIKFVSDASIFGCYAISAVDDADQDPNGQANESPLSAEVCIESCFTIGFPNVFTPNGDNVYETFLPTNVDQVSELQIEIFNRWGTKVYEALSLAEFLAEGWDGTVESNGQQAPEGVYYYICRYRPETLGPSREQVASGFVHLFR